MGRGRTSDRVVAENGQHPPIGIVHVTGAPALRRDQRDLGDLRVNLQAREEADKDGANGTVHLRPDSLSAEP